MKKYIFYTILLFCMAYMLNGCYTQKKASTQLNKAVASYPILGAQFCSVTYPPKESIDTNIIYTKADNVDLKPQLDSVNGELQNYKQAYFDAIDAMQGDTACVDKIKQLQAQYDALVSQYQALQKKYKPCAPDTVHILITKTVENTAHVSALQMDSTAKALQITDLNKKLASAQSQASKRLWIIILENAIIAIVIFGSFYLKLIKIV